jgi:secreted trypsin-like serine protease
MRVLKSAQSSPRRRFGKRLRRRLQMEELEKRLPLSFNPTALWSDWEEGWSTAVSVEPAEAEGTVTGKIVGGSESTPGAWPWMASVQYSNSHLCGGALISPTWILTAAHCFVDSKTGQPINSELSGRLTAVLGRHDLRTTVGESLAVERIVLHPQYDPAQNAWYNRQYDFDLALLKLAKPSTQIPISFARLNDAAQYAPGVNAVVTGWGATTEGDKIPPSTLQQVVVPIVSNATAQTAHLTTITENMLAAGLAGGGKDSCQGDSGGPLMVESGSGTYLHVGVVSFGQGCARPQYYGIYTRTANFFELDHCCHYGLDRHELVTG